jgi:hypothetical protein
MTLAGWLLLAFSCGTITALVVFCYWRVLRTPSASQEMHAPLDIDTHDTDDPASG